MQRSQQALFTALWLLGSAGCEEAAVRLDRGRTDGVGAVDHDGLPPIDQAGAATELSVSSDRSGAADAAGGGPPPGTLLFKEEFEDSSFAARGWYDSPAGTLSSTEAKVGKSAFECLYKKGSTGCAGKTPGRRLFPASESVYLSYWVKYSANFVGSQKPYHPHEFHFVTTADDKWVGPSYSHLTTYIEQIGGVPVFAMQDSRNVDLKCVLLNNGSTVGGCNGGSFASYPFTENRSVCACNGIVGTLDKKDCYNTGSYFYSARGWHAKQVYFKDQPGPEYKNDWHLVEVYLKMNSIVGGKGVPDAIARYWYDGKLIIDQTGILMRTGQHPDLKFNQFLFGTYIGDGSPVDQTMWVDQLVVGTGKP